MLEEEKASVPPKQIRAIIKPNEYYIDK